MPIELHFHLVQRTSGKILGLVQPGIFFRLLEGFDSSTWKGLEPSTTCQGLGIDPLQPLFLFPNMKGLLGVDLKALVGVVISWSGEGLEKKGSQRLERQNVELCDKEAAGSRN